MSNAKSKSPMVALRLTVYNHPGVMTHVCGMFARRAFNVEGIFVMPIGNTDTSRIWLLVYDDERLEQMIRQTRKLCDVIEVLLWPGGVEAFSRFTTFMTIWEGANLDTGT
jgi:acetolactate synthase-1/3 small subunit